MDDCVTLSSLLFITGMAMYNVFHLLQVEDVLVIWKPNRAIIPSLALFSSDILLSIAYPNHLHMAQYRMIIC